MIRKLLACLALLTGLAAAGAPVQAEMASALAAHCEARAAAPAVSGGTAALVRVELARRPQAAFAASPEPLGDTRAPQPAVRLGCDRARE
ncbi:MAG: hypothetical protein JNJ92_09995 [Altererythrobacter sp.]|nr:hypothetical protein [Altererythrobacter sp.]